MDSHYCPMCGDHHGEPRSEAAAEADVAAEVSSAEIEIARIQADRDVTLARIGAGVETKVLDTEREAELAHAEGRAEGMEAVIDAATPDAPPEPGPIVIDAPPAEPEPQPDMLPVADKPEPPREKKRSSNLFGF